MLVDKGRYVKASHICCRGWNFMATAEDDQDEEGRQPSFLQELDESMLLVREDVCEWLTRIMCLSPEEAVKPSEFLDRLDDGVIMCKLLKIIDDAAGPDDKKIKPPRCRANATSGSWFARDNIASFLKCCRQIGLRDELLFETEGLVMHSEEKNLILTLLELARLGANRNLDMPRLVQMEREIDREQSDLVKIDEFDGLIEKCHSPQKQLKSAEISEEKSATDDSSQNESASVNEEQNSTKLEESSNDKSQEEEKTNVVGTPVVLSSPVDVYVHDLASSCKCPTPFRIERLREGTYLLNGRRCFLRLFKDNVMVRVGGGWLTLSQYLYRHDPCRIINVSSTTRPKYMVARGRYKTNK